MLTEYKMENQRPKPKPKHLKIKKLGIFFPAHQVFFIKTYRMASCSLNLLCLQLKLIKMQLVSRIVSFVCTNCCPIVRFIRLQARRWESSCYGGRRTNMQQMGKYAENRYRHAANMSTQSANTWIMQTLKDARTHKKANETEKCSKNLRQSQK